MKKIIIGLLSGVFLLVITCCAVVYKAPDFPQRQRQHKLIAITPLNVTVQYRKLPEGVTVDEIKKNEEDLGRYFQDQLYTRFLQRIDSYTIDFQDVSKTNNILNQNNINYQLLRDYSKEDLASHLGVDAVLSGNIITSQPMSTGGAVAMAFLLGLWGPTNTVGVAITIHDGSDSKLLWKYEHTYSGTIGSSSEQVTKALFKHLSKKFPYLKYTSRTRNSDLFYDDLYY
ncbi:MAG: hypothetical protein ISS19_06295 [Bacteroidales bacterium]|nr:hypothetical protein [Bacteroidales bacterium]